MGLLAISEAAKIIRINKSRTKRRSMTRPIDRGLAVTYLRRQKLNCIFIRVLPDEVRNSRCRTRVLVACGRRLRCISIRDARFTRDSVEVTLRGVHDATSYE